MKTQELNVPAGKLFCTSSGEYSDYSYSGHFVALEDITREKLEKIEDQVHETIRSDDDLDKYDARGLFLPALIRSGLVLEVDCVEIHTGSYGTLELT